MTGIVIVVPAWAVAEPITKFGPAAWVGDAKRKLQNAKVANAPLILRMPDIADFIFVIGLPLICDTFPSGHQG